MTTGHREVRYITSFLLFLIRRRRRRNFILPQQLNKI